MDEIINIPMPQTKQEVAELLGVSCAQCLETYKDTPNVLSILHTHYCTRCEHLYGEVVEQERMEYEK